MLSQQVMLKKKSALKVPCLNRAIAKRGNCLLQLLELLSLYSDGIAACDKHYEQLSPAWLSEFCNILTMSLSVQMISLTLWPFAEASSSGSEEEARDSESEVDPDSSASQPSEEPQDLAEQPVVQGRKAKRKLGAMEGSLTSLKKQVASASRATKAKLEPPEQGKYLTCLHKQLMIRLQQPMLICQPSLPCPSAPCHFRETDSSMSCITLLVRRPDCQTIDPNLLQF